MSVISPLRETANKLSKYRERGRERDRGATDTSNRFPVLVKQRDLKKDDSLVGRALQKEDHDLQNIRKHFITIGRFSFAFD